MTYPLSQKQRDSVSALAPQERYDHFVKRVADFEEIWGLWSANGWALSTSSQNQKEVASFWPHPEYARFCASGAWHDCEPKAISLNDFIERWLPGLARDGRLVSVFSTPSSAGILLTPEELGKALRTECRSQYGDEI